MDLPASLDPVLSARLRELLRAAATPDGEAGAGALHAALDDPAVHAVVIAVQLRGEPVASLVQEIRASDPIAAWLDLSCI
jgi:DNA-binding NarL/FixJ family response regulator